MADPVETPQFAFPFRFEAQLDGTVAPAVVEQDTPEDILNAVELILRTPLGWREELPEFGVEDPSFRQQPLDVSRISAALTRWEPRATINITTYPDSLDEALAHIRIEVEAE